MARAHRRRRRGFSINRRRKHRRARTNPYFMNRPRRRRRSYATNRRRRHHAARAHSNPVRRRRRYFSNRRRRHYRSNPGGLSVMGFQIPAVMDIAAVGAGFVVPPLITGYVMGWLPDSLKTSRAAYWAVKAAAVLVPSMAVRSFVSRRAGNLMLLGGTVSFVLDLIKEFAPGVIPGLGYQPLLGAFTAPPQFSRARMPPQRQGLPRMIAGTPDRLDPTARF